MVANWQDTHWGDLATLEYGRALRGYSASTGTYRVFGTNGPIGWHDEPLCGHASVIVGRKGAYRGVHYSPNPFFAIDTAFYLEPKTEIDVRWAYYELLTKDINGMDSGSAIPSTTREAFYRLPVRVPPLSDQRAIGHILGALDDKIELNRRMSETLEAMARAIFKSWFVDFDPVRAKADGSKTGLYRHLTEIFPSSFVESELGEIPEEWRAGRLDDLLILQRGFDLPSTERRRGPYPVISASGLQGGHDKFMAVGPGVTTGRSGVLGKVFYIHSDFWPLNTSLWVKDFKHATPTYAFYLLQTLDFAGFNAGSAVPTLNRNHVHNLNVVVPSMQAIQTFEAVVGPLKKRQKLLDEQSETLAATRDTLLPKLISGELRVKDAEGMVEKVA
jgi:type I restriction enzyme S subunit